MICELKDTTVRLTDDRQSDIRAPEEFFVVRTHAFKEINRIHYGNSLVCEVHSFINGSTALCLALASSSVL
jgi:hypothetical protein